MMSGVNWPAVRSAFDAQIQADGVDCDFTLRSGETFTIRGVLRFEPEESRTDGIQADRRKLSIMASRWEAAAPVNRHPEKGDRVAVMGQRFAIEEADPAIAGQERIGWRPSPSVSSSTPSRLGSTP